MKEILLNPGVLALIGVTITAGPVWLKYIYSHKDSSRKIKLSTDEKSKRLTFWYMENYHRARRLLIDNGHADLVELKLPFEPTHQAIQERDEV